MQEYIRGIQAWNFSPEDLNNQIDDFDKIPDPEDPKANSKHENGFNDVVLPVEILSPEISDPKGFECNFSHGLNVQGKGYKIDISSDKHDGEDKMEEWGQEMLEKVIDSKGIEYNQIKPTDIVCRHFLDAVEKRKNVLQLISNICLTCFSNSLLI